MGRASFCCWLQACSFVMGWPGSESQLQVIGRGRGGTTKCDEQEHEKEYRQSDRSPCPGLRQLFSKRIQIFMQVVDPALQRLRRCALRLHILSERLLRFALTLKLFGE